MTGAFPATAPVQRFPPEPASAGEARRFVGQMLTGAGDDLIDRARLLVSELVTNAVLHANSELEVRVWARAGRVHVRVTDHAADRPLVPRPADADAATGRGLQLVEALASDYGVEVDVAGKTVWFELWTDPSVEPASASDAGWPPRVCRRAGTGRSVLPACRWR